MRERIAIAAALCIAIAGILAGATTIAHADAGGTCIYNAKSNPTSGYPTLPACDSTRNVRVAVSNGSSSAAIVGAANADSNSPVTNTLAVSPYTLAFNGTTWDRVRSQSGEIQITDGGARLLHLTATTCTDTGAKVVHKVWTINGSGETSNLILFSDAACTQKVWQQQPTTITALDISNGASDFYYEMSATPAANDYMSTN